MFRAKADRRGCSYNIINIIIFIYFLKFSIIKKKILVRARQSASAGPGPPFRARLLSTPLPSGS
jgi:hypothetical protein